MTLSEQIDFAHLHHAYLIVGDRKDIFPDLTRCFEIAGISVKGNPDFHTFECDVLLLEDAQEIRREQTLTGADRALKIFVIAFHTMTSEAQNALLKTIEEPTSGTHFFFITRTGEALIETIRSRVFLIQYQEDETDNLLIAGEEFLKSSVPERLKLLEWITKVKTDDKARAKEEARVFLESLERALHMQKPIVEPTSLRDVFTAKRYLSDRAPSLKILLEHLALTLPTRSPKTESR